MPVRKPNRGGMESKMEWRQADQCEIHISSGGRSLMGGDVKDMGQDD